MLISNSVFLILGSVHAGWGSRGSVKNSEMVKKKVNETVGIIREQKREHIFWCFLPLHKLMDSQHLESWAQPEPFCLEKSKVEMKDVQGKAAKVIRGTK